MASASAGDGAKIEAAGAQHREAGQCTIIDVIQITRFRASGWSEVLKETNAMKKLFTVLLVASVMAGPAMAESLAGFVSDEHCGARHDSDAGNSDKSCVKSCVKRGSAPVLVVDVGSAGRVYKIANPDAVKDVVGEKVTIEGTVSGDTVTIASVKVDH